MDAPSSDGVEILEPSAFAAHRPATRPPQASTSRGGTTGGARKIAPQLSNVIELSDGSDDEFALPPPPKRGARLDDEEDDDVLVVGGTAALNPVTRTKRPLPDPSSDELPSASALWGVRAPVPRAGASAMGRSASLSAAAGPSTSTAQSAPLARAHTTLGWMSDLSSSQPRGGAGAGAASSPRGFPPLPGSGGFRSSSPGWPPPAAAATKGKGKARAPDAGRGSSLFLPDQDIEEDAASRSFAEDLAAAKRARAPARATEEDDPWADILASPGAGAKGKGRGKAKEGAKGKGKEREVSLEAGAGRKRSLSAVVPEGADVVPGPAGKKKAIRPPPDDATAPPPAALSKTAQKKLETADRMRLRAANTLRAGDKHASTAELTMHISGRAFDAPPQSDSEDEDVAAGAGRKRPRKKAPKPSPWVEISREVRERLRLYACDVECPEVPRQGVRALDAEGAVRWTRVCDRVWSEERRMFLPLQDGEKIVVEEDSRLVFLTALDLSTHVANRTLSTHVASLQSRLAPHVNLFILLFGLPTLFRDMERARQEAYRNSVRADGAGAGERAVKPAGIGTNQPGKDDLELELMRVQIQSHCMIVSVDKVPEAVDWLEQLTFDVGQKPYQRLKHSHVSLLGTSEDKVASGKDLQDTYIKMLASLPKVTEPVAKGIVAEYPTLRTLYEAWAACRDEKGRREMLVGIGRGRNLDGTATHRAIGKDLSATIYRIMTGRDPNMFL
ncbi:hypothetical protein JCM10450v2_002394 [Rhodotorula kratochvilovae]